jgi:hypothetical protein
MEQGLQSIPILLWKGASQMKKLMIDRINFDLAFESNATDSDTEVYLHVENGDILFVVEDVRQQLNDLITDQKTLEDTLLMLQENEDLSEFERDALMEAARVEYDENDRYRMFPRQDSREGYEDMEMFIASLKDNHLAELLEVAIRGSGAFRRFKDVLFRDDEAQQKWYDFKEYRENQRRLDWLTSLGITPEFE